MLVMVEYTSEPNLTSGIGTIRGLLLMRQNPVIGGHNTHMLRMALANLE